MKDKLTRPLSARSLDNFLQFDMHFVASEPLLSLNIAR